jgi:hypothetical protein
VSFSPERANQRLLFSHIQRIEPSYLRFGPFFCCPEDISKEAREGYKINHNRSSNAFSLLRPKPSEQRMYLHNTPRKWHIGERMPVGVADDEAGVGLLDGPGRREAGRSTRRVAGVADDVSGQADPASGRRRQGDGKTLV